MDSSTDAPRTPSRPGKTSSSGIYTPKSSAAQYLGSPSRTDKPLSTPKRLPCLDSEGFHSPEIASSPAHYSDTDFSENGSCWDSSRSFCSPVTPLSLPGLSLFLPTPLTVGSGMKSRKEMANIHHFARPLPLLEMFQEIARPTLSDTRNMGSGLPLESLGPEYADVDSPLALKSHAKHAFLHDFDSGSTRSSVFDSFLLRQCSQDQHKLRNMPQIPPHNTTIEQKPLFELFSESEDTVQVITVEDIDRIPRFELPNPFIDRETCVKRLCFRRKLDGDSELVNNRTKERKIEALSRRQMQFKSRKLDFMLAVNAPNVARLPDYKIANKYVESRIGKNFVVGETRAKGSLDFDIFSDKTR